MTTARTRTPGLPQLLTLLVASTLPILGAVLIAPVLPQIAAHFAAVPGIAILVPITLTIPALVIGLTAPFAGLIVDRLGRLRVLTVGLIGFAVVGTAPLWLDDIGMIIGSRVLLGVFEAGLTTSAITLIGDYWTEERDRYIGYSSTAASLSGVLFIAIGGFLGTGGWRVPFFVYLFSLVVLVPATLVLWQPERPSHAMAATRTPVPWRALAAPVGTTLFGGIIFYALIVELSTVLTGVGMTSSAQIGLVTVAMAVATAVGAALFGRLIRYGRQLLLTVEFVLSGIGLLLVFATTSIAVITTGAVITGFATGLLFPTLITWALDKVDFAQRGRGAGLWNGAAYVGQFLSALVIAGLSAVWGGVQGGIGILGVVSIVVGLAIWPLLGTRRPTSTDALPVVGRR